MESSELKRLYQEGFRFTVFVDGNQLNVIEHFKSETDAIRSVLSTKDRWLCYIDEAGWNVSYKGSREELSELLEREEY